MGSPTTLAGGRLICVDGPAGSGKTTFAEALRGAVPAGVSCRVLHMDDLYPGWSGLAEGVSILGECVVAPLSRGVVGGYRRFDWLAERHAEQVEVAPVDLLVVEGVGCGARAIAERITTLVWIEAGPETRLARGLARDGQPARHHWVEWMRAEESWFDREQTRQRADVALATDDLSAPPEHAAQPPA